MTSAIQTLKDGLNFCEDYLKTENISEENIKIKQKQIKEHKLAIKILTEHESIKEPKCKICGDTGYFSFGGSFGGTVNTVSCSCKNK